MYAYATMFVVCDHHDMAVVCVYKVVLMCVCVIMFVVCDHHGMAVCVSDITDRKTLVEYIFYKNKNV